MSRKYAEHTRPNRDSHLDAVRDFYLNITSKRPRELTPDQEHYRQRLVSVWTLLCRYHSDEQARKIHQKAFGIHEVTAYKDLRNAVDLFGDVRYTEKAGRRAILAEWCANTYQRAIEKGDVKSANRSIENMIKLLGLDGADADAPDFERLQPSLIVAALPEGMEQSIQAMLRGGAINLNQFPEAEIVENENTESEPGATATEGN